MTIINKAISKERLAEMAQTHLLAKPDKDKWAAMDFITQMANIGSEVGRTLKWKQKRNSTLAKNAFIRALDLFDLTIETGRNKAPLHPEIQCSGKFLWQETNSVKNIFPRTPMR